MSILPEAQAKKILAKVVAHSKADECTAQLVGSTNGNVRFALNNVSTSGIVDNIELSVSVAFGKRVGIATINQFDDASLETVVRRAEDLAKLAPENPEFMPAVEKQTYKPSCYLQPVDRRHHPRISRKSGGGFDWSLQKRQVDRCRFPGGSGELCRLPQQQGQLRLPDFDQQ